MVNNNKLNQLNKPYLFYISRDENYKNIHHLENHQHQYSEIFKDVFESPIKTIEPIGSFYRQDDYLRLELDFLVTIESLHDITMIDEKRLNYHQIYRSYKNHDKKAIFNHFKSMKTLRIDGRYHIVEYGSNEYEHHRYIHTLLSDKQSDLYQQFIALKKSSIKNQVPHSIYERQKINLFNEHLKF